MPYTFTEQEKQALRQEYLDNLAALNSVLDDGHKIKVDLAAFNKKINDPQQVWFYKKSLEQKAILTKQKEIQERLNKKYKPQRIPGKAYELDRLLHTELIPSDDPEAEAYNDEVIRMYTLHPEAMVQRRFQTVLNFDLSYVSDMAKCKDIDNLMLLLSSREPTVLEDSCQMISTLNSNHIKELLTPQMKTYFRPICGNYENLIDASNDFKKVNEGYFTVPHYIDDYQENAINGPDISRDHPRMYKLLVENLAHNKGGDMLKDQWKQFFSNLPKYGVNVKEPGALSSVYILPNKGRNQPTSLPEIVNNPDNVNNPTLVTLPPEDVAAIKKIFVEDYTKEPGFKMPEMPEKFKKPAYEAAREELVFKYAIKLDKPVHELDNGGFSEIAASFRGNVKERIFGTTSLEYKHLITTMKDFENPNHVGYQKSMPVKLAANQYLIHKGVTSREQAMQLPSPAKERSILCFDIIETFQKNEGPEVSKIVPGTNQRVEVQRPIERVQAIVDPSLVEDEPVGVEQEEPAQEKKRSMSADDIKVKDDEAEIEDPDISAGN